MGLRYRRITRTPPRLAETPLVPPPAESVRTQLLTFGISEDDDPAYVDIVASVLDSVVGDNKPQIVVIVQIDNWFDRKWLQFSGKILGALGVWKKELTVPPFNPKRVKSQTALRLADSGEYAEYDARPLHVLQRSSENLNRKVIHMADSVVLVWWSSNTIVNDRASLMIYGHDKSDSWAWYAAFRRAADWKLEHTLKIPADAVREMIG